MLAIRILLCQSYLSQASAYQPHTAPRPAPPPTRFWIPNHPFCKPVQHIRHSYNRSTFFCFTLYCLLQNPRLLNLTASPLCLYPIHASFVTVLLLFSISWDYVLCLLPNFRLQSINALCSLRPFTIPQPMTTTLPPLSRYGAASYAICCFHGQQAR